MKRDPSVHRYWYRLLLPTALSLALFTGCGDGSENLPPPPTTPDTSTATASDALNALGKGDASDEKLNEIIATLNDLKAKIEALENDTVASTASTTDKPTTTASSKPTSSSSTGTSKPSTSASGSSSSPATPAKDTKAEGAEILGKLMQYVGKAPAIDAVVVQSEKQLGGSKQVTNKLQMYARQPGVVKIKVLASSKNPAGTQLLYESKPGALVSVRPGSGIASKLTVKLDQADDRISSNNGFLMHQTDFFGMARRLGPGTYEAEVVGTIEGGKYNVLKVKAKGTNGLTPKITHEHIAYDPKTLNIRYWQAFAAETGATTPFIQYQLESFAVKSSLPETYFKIQ